MCKWAHYLYKSRLALMWTEGIYKSSKMTANFMGLSCTLIKCNSSLYPYHFDIGYLLDEYWIKFVGNQIFLLFISESWLLWREFLPYKSLEPLWKWQWSWGYGWGNWESLLGFQKSFSILYQRLCKQQVRWGKR